MCELWFPPFRTKGQNLVHEFLWRFMTFNILLGVSSKLSFSLAPDHAIPVGFLPGLKHTV